MDDVEGATPLVDVPAQERVAKLARRIVAVDQPAKIADARVPTLQHRGRHREQLGPVRYCAEWCELLLDQWKQPVHGVPFRLPRGMEGDTSPVVAGAHPEIIGGDGAHL